VDSDRSVGQRVNGYSPLCLCVVLPVLCFLASSSSIQLRALFATKKNSVQLRALFATNVRFSPYNVRVLPYNVRVFP
jgi:hypothetical protein